MLQDSLGSCDLAIKKKKRGIYLEEGYCKIVMIDHFYTCTFMESFSMEIG